MCRNIKPLFNVEPSVTDEEVRDAALQFVRKVSGFRQPSRANDAAFHAATEDITAATHRLLAALTTAAPPRQRVRGKTHNPDG